MLDDLSFTLPRGRITGLLGPSGCGTCTLMRALVGAQAHVTGTLTVLGRPTGHRAPRSRVGYVTQAPCVYADLSARQNLDHYAAVLGIPARDRTAQVDRSAYGGVPGPDAPGGREGPGPPPLTGGEPVTQLA